jgi:hypothetical protein
MSVVEYQVTNNDQAIAVDIIEAQRRHARASGERAEIQICRHFDGRGDNYGNPGPSPETADRYIFGRYEAIGSATPFDKHCTAQINQAGNYLFGWMQIDLFSADNLDIPGVVTLYFYGKLTDGGRLTVVIEYTAPRDDVTVGGRIRAVSDTEVDFELDAPHRYRLGATWVEIASVRLQKVSVRPRLPEESLRAGGHDRAYYLAEARPLCSDHVSALQDIVQNHLSAWITRCEGMPAAQREPTRSAIFTFIRDILAIRRLPRFRRIGGRQCTCLTGDATTRVRNCRCGVMFRREQEPLIRALLLTGLETTIVDGRTLLEKLYNIGYSDADDSPSNDLRNFATAFGLPEHLAHYRYDCRVIYGEGAGKIGSSGVQLGGRFAQLRMTRFTENESGQWVRQDAHNFYTVMGIVKVGISRSRRPGGSGARGSRIPGDVQVGIQRFRFHTHRRWNWNDFIGYWEIFGASAQVKFPYSAWSWGPSDSAAMFHGRGHMPPLAVTLEDVSGQDIGNSREFAAALEFIWMPGYLYGRSAERRDAPDDPRLAAEDRARLNSATFSIFDINIPTLTADGKDTVGFFLAENMVAFISATSHLALHGHASRTGLPHHNVALSIRRAQYSFQAILDIMGPLLDIPLTSAQCDRMPQAGNGAGTVTLCAYGEEMAAAEGLPDEQEDFLTRRVDIRLNGRGIMRLAGPHRSG